MQFRTEIGDIKGTFGISHDDRIVLVGSCFADNIGERLVRDGFQAVHNPLGSLFNPASIAMAIFGRSVPYSAAAMVKSDDSWHCLDFASRYQSNDIDLLVDMVNRDFDEFKTAVAESTVIIITFGTNKVYEYNDSVVGNCHKIPQSNFSNRFLETAQIRELWKSRIRDKRVIFTLSPVKYPGDGLQQSCLSKSVLRVAINDICNAHGYDYFPAYEIVTEDLRDYRFYAADMKHPSEQAADYIYDKFASAYFSGETMSKAISCRKEFLRKQHRPIIK